MLQIKKKQYHAAGFTVLELVVAISIFSFLILVTVDVLSMVFSGSKQQLLAIDNVDSARSVTSRFVTEIRNASVGIDGSYQIGTANNNQIIFYSKTAAGGATVNRINYYLSGTTLYKGIVVPSGNPLVYNLASEAIAIVQKDVSNAGTPIFTYYDGSYNGITSPLSQPVNVNSIKYIKMNLMVLKQVEKQSPAKFSITAGGAIRNLKTNLGD